MNPSLDNLKGIYRPDLASTFSKLHLWSLTQYTTVIYLDADTLPLRSLDELFTSPSIGPFAASTEMGFPDSFNSGMMVLTPSLTTHMELLAMAARGETYDGGDQGLLNVYFSEEKWHRLSFCYNIECSDIYHLFMPALNRVRDRWGVVHFIGRRKPWDWKGGIMDEYGDVSRYGDMYRDMVDRWWGVWEEITGKEGMLRL